MHLLSRPSGQAEAATAPCSDVHRACPRKVPATMFTVLKVVAQAQPKRFAGTGIAKLRAPLTTGHPLSLRVRNRSGTLPA